MRPTTKSIRTFGTAALCVGLTAGLALAASPATAAPSAPASASDVQSATSGVTITSGSTYVIGERATVTGTAAPSTALYLKVGSSLTLTRADDAGRWTATSQAPLNGRVQTIEVTDTSLRPLVTTTLRGVPRDAVVVTSPTTFTAGERLVLSGTARPGSTIDIEGWTAGIAFERATADADGNWTFRSMNAVRGGEHVLNVGYQNAAHTDRTAVTIRSTSGVVFTPLEVTSERTFVPGQTTTVEGKATPGADVLLNLYNPGEKPVPGGTFPAALVTRADAAGNWKLDIANHRLPTALVQQSGKLGADHLTLEFTRA